MSDPELTTTQTDPEHDLLFRRPARSESGPWETRVSLLAHEMTAAWGKGDYLVTEHFLDRHPELWQIPAAVMDLLYEEICLRHQFGRPVLLADFVSRFPTWKREIEVLVQCVKVLEPDADDKFPVVGESLGDFRLLTELGRGSQGCVFLATQSSLGDRPVVLKFSHRAGCEHLSLARLQHTHIVPVLSVFEDHDRDLRGLCMPYFGGLPLRALLDTLKDRLVEERSGQHILEILDEARAAAAIALPPSRAPATPFLTRASYVESICWLGACLAEALKYAHERGLVHLDLKPSNVLLTADRQPMLLDFHLAREPLRPGDPGTRFGGTPLYMSPEQKKAMAAIRAGAKIAETVDGRSDIYSLGLVLHEALSGELPSDSQPPAPLHQLQAKVSLGLSDIIAKCLAPEVRHRYQDAGALAGDLWGHLNHLPLKGVANRSLGERWRKWRRRQPHLLALLLMLGAVLAVAGAALTFALGSANQRVADAKQALADGQKHMESGQYSEGAQAFKRGLAHLENLPGQQDLKDKLTRFLDLSSRGRMARELHQIADRCRFFYALDVPNPARLKSLEANCLSFWAKRQMILDRIGKEMGPELEHQAQLDLLDLAIIGSNLRVQLAAPSGAVAARHEALQTLDQAEAFFEPTAALFNERRQHADALGLTEETRTAKLQAAKYPPRTAWEFYALGRSLLQANDLEAAATAFDRAIAMEPSGLWPHFYQGVCCYRLGRFDDAALAFTTCSALAPQAANCFYNRALAFAGWGRTDRALADYDRALSLEPELAEAALGRGILHFKAKHLLEASADLQQALKLGVNPASAHYYLALVCLAQHDRAEALAHLEYCRGPGPNQAKVNQLLESLRPK